MMREHARRARKPTAPRSASLMRQRRRTCRMTSSEFGARVFVHTGPSLASDRATAGAPATIRRSGAGYLRTAGTTRSVAPAPGARRGRPGPPLSRTCRLAGHRHDSLRPDPRDPGPIRPGRRCSRSRAAAALSRAANLVKALLGQLRMRATRAVAGERHARCPAGLRITRRRLATALRRRPTRPAPTVAQSAAAPR